MPRAQGPSGLSTPQRVLTPFQYHAGNWYNGSAATQIIPSGSWTPVTFNQLISNEHFPLDPPTEGAAAYTVLNTPTLTPTGSHTIEIAAGEAANLETPSSLYPKWLSVYDTVNDEYQVVRYTGLSAGTGSGGRDEITGVSKGSWDLSTSTFEVRQTNPCYITGNDPEIWPFYLAQSVCCIGWESATGGVRRVRMVTWFNFGSILLTNDAANIYYGQDLPGANTGAGPSSNPPACQFQTCTGQPGVELPGGGGVAYPFFEVYQDTGSDLGLARNGLPAVPIIMNAWFPTTIES